MMASLYQSGSIDILVAPFAIQLTLDVPNVARNQGIFPSESGGRTRLPRLRQPTVSRRSKSFWFLIFNLTWHVRSQALPPAADPRNRYAHQSRERDREGPQLLHSSMHGCITRPKKRS